MTHIEVPFSDPSVRSLILAAFPGETSKRNVKVRIAETYHVSDYWSEGSRDYCACVKLDTLEVIPLGTMPGYVRQEKNNPMNLQIGEVSLIPGVAIVEHTIFCGKDLGFRVYLHADNLAPMLTAKPADITEREGRILATFRSYTSAYRKEELARMKVSEAELAPLLARGFLKRSSNGATGITNEGRSACANVR